MAELNTSSDNPGVIAFPPFIWLAHAVISTLVHFLLIQLPIMRYGISLVCGIALIILAPTLALWALVTMKAAGTNVAPGKPASRVRHQLAGSAPKKSHSSEARHFRRASSSVGRSPTGRRAKFNGDLCL